VDARETADVVDGVVADLMNEIIRRHTVSAAVAPGAVVPAYSHQTAWSIQTVTVP